LVLDALCGEESATAIDLRKATTPVVNLWQRDLHKIRDSCKLLLHAWYLDDGTVIGDSEEVARVLDIIKVSGPGLSLELIIKKTEIFWPSFNGVKLREGLFPIDIRRPSLGVKLLGESC
ncbi:hypothetical protein Tco_0880608, partial [Tanacetum coccineum]